METLARAANRGSVSTGGYEIANSLKLETDNNEHLQRGTYPTLGTPTNAKIATISYWGKRTELISNNAHFGWIANAGANSSWVAFEQDKARVYTGGGNSLMSNAVFRDTSAWYHFVAAFDMTQSTASNRVKIYINGEQITSFQLETYGAQNNDIGIYDLNMSHHIGYGSGQGFSGYITEVYLIDGQQLLPTDFGEFDEDTGIWKPKEYTGTFGNQGYYINMSNSANLGEDSSGNGNDFGNLNNITSADQATDTPTNNFCTLNPLINPKYAYSKMAEGATVYDSTAGGISGALGTFGVTSGKWYWECKLTEQNTHYIGVSAVDDGDNITSASDPQDINSSFIFNIAAARIEYINSGTKTYGSNDAFTDFHTVGDVIGIALNMDDNQISIYGNGTLQSGVANSSLYDAANKMVVPLHATLQDEVQYNFGGYSAWTPSSAETDANGYGTFEYAPPTGYYALCTKNLAEFG